MRENEVIFFTLFFYVAFYSLFFTPFLTGSKTPASRFERNKEDKWEIIYFQ
jgi:hypothetical protein